MMTARRRNQGFTLVEILIVVVILGILAAIVIPQFTSASETARASSLVSQLQTIRSQIELYQVQHNGNYPTVAQLNDTTTPWSVMVSETDETGSMTATDTPFGPYLRKAPANPFFTADATTVTDISGGDSYAATGWGYNPNTGEVKAMVPNTVDDATLSTFDQDNDVIVQAGL